MDYSELQSQVLACFPSDALKKRIAELDYRIPPNDLLFAIYQFSPTHVQRMRLLEELAQAAPEIADHVRLVLDWQKRVLEQFRTAQPGTVFELRIQESPDDMESRWLFGSFEAAEKMMDLYLEDDLPDLNPDECRRTIVKRRINGFPYSHEQEDELGKCSYGDGNRLLNATLWNEDSEYGCILACHKCAHKDCVTVNYPVFPWQPKTGTPVYCRIPGGHVGWSGYGVAWSDPSWESGCDCFIIPLRQTWEEPETESDLYSDHHHVPSPYVMELTPDAVPQPLREHLQWLCRQFRHTT